MVWDHAYKHEKIKVLHHLHHLLKVDTEAWEKHGIPESDGIEIMKEEIERERMQTLSFIEPLGKHRNK